MIYVFVCRDAANSRELRALYRDQHLAFIETVMDQVAVAGPCLPPGTDDAKAAQASILAYHADSQKQAEALFQQDPYFNNGIWESYEVFALKPVVGTWIGGKTW
ncbi:MAG: YciI family protein [Xanthomonadales bacterium]|nr:YciI family protein [Xanthomonadales bacterium]